jgi:hypothetical protein
VAVEIVSWNGQNWVMPAKLSEQTAIAVMKKAGLVPLEPYKTALKPWKCRHLKCGEIVSPSYASVQQGGSGCKHCSKTFVKPADAVKIMKLAKLTPLEPYTSSQTRWKCQCLTCKIIVFPRFGNISSGRGGCAQCSNIAKGISRRADTAKRAVPIMKKAKIQPLTPYTSARENWKCKCLRCERIIYPSFNQIQQGGGCPYCAGVKVDLVEVKRIMIASGLKPLEKYKSKDSPWKCKCLTCGTTVYPYWNNIRNGAGGCGRCRYFKSGKSNRTPEKDAIKFMLEADLQPLEPYLNKEIPWKCKCLKCKQVVYPSAGNIKRGQGGCSYCRETGLNYNDPAYIYLIFHKKYKSIKIGVSNNNSRPNRLKCHQKEGWGVYKTKNYKTGFKAEKVETGIIRWLRKDLMLGRHLKADLMPQGGYSETVDALEIDLPTIWAKVEELSSVTR